jgi:molecular chaperone DnaJ
VEDGARLRLSGEGNEGEGGRGDLYVMVRIKPHKVFKREGNDIICEVPISFPQAALGTELEVPTLDGHTKLHIPAGTQNDKVFRLKGKGIPYLHGYGRGDQYVRVKVMVPTSLSEKEKALLREFARLRGERIKEESFFEKFKKGAFGN